MWYLVLYITGAYAPAMAIIPEKYPTEQACHDAANGKVWSEKWSHGCIPAPQPTSMCNVSVMPGSAYGILVPCDHPVASPKPNCVTNINSGKLECN